MLQEITRAVLFILQLAIVAMHAIWHGNVFLIVLVANSNLPVEGVQDMFRQVITMLLMLGCSASMHETVLRSCGHALGEYLSDYIFSSHCELQFASLQVCNPAVN